MERPGVTKNYNVYQSLPQLNKSTSPPPGEDFYRTMRENIQREQEKELMQKQQEEASRAKCPTCNQTRLDAQRTAELDSDIMGWIRSSNAMQLDSCILCVEKHIGRAMVAYDELCSASNSGMSNGEAVINPYKARLLVIGHLGHAIEESYEYTELHDLLQDNERSFRYSCKAPSGPK